jgi:CubicO group peptidase (beta-lactamase class C family)
MKILQPGKAFGITSPRASTVAPRTGCLVGFWLLISLLAGRAEPFVPAPPSSQGFDAVKLEQLQTELAQRSTKGLLIIRRDRIVWEWYAPDHGQDQRHYTASLAKSLAGGLSLLVACQNGLIHPDDVAANYIPHWRDDPLKSKITIRQLAAHASGIEDAEEAGRPHAQLTGWKGAFWKREPDPFSIAVREAPVLFEPGAEFAYSNPGMAALAYAVTASLRESPHRDTRALLEHRVMRRIGIENRDWSIGYGRTYEVDGLPLVANWGGGNFTARAVARIGRLLLREGEWDGETVLDPKWVQEILTHRGTPLPKRSETNPSPAPALGFYNNSDGIWPEVPRDAFAGAGAGHQVLLVVPSLELIVVRNGGALEAPASAGNFWGALEKHLFNPLMAALEERSQSAHPKAARPYPPSPVIRDIVWALKESIIQKARGSDNWPLTWADDGHQYTAYGDGWGFEPRLPEKLSLGLVRVEGTPPDFNGVNIRSASGEKTGDGARGLKASGMLMVDGVLYMWVRNAGNSQLAWSKDHGTNWTWSDWKFTKSFGCPTFLNFGRNYAEARDDYVYTYSFDSDSAYQPADRMVLARVPKTRIQERTAYEFFAGLDESGQPLWTADKSRCAAVFTHRGQCYRSGVTYNPGIKRYLWVQILPGGDLRFQGGKGDPRFEGGFAIFDAPEPWGPWTTVYFTELWDTGPGETASFPVKWMSPDGTSLHLVFSGDDFFSVRQAKLVLSNK